MSDTHVAIAPKRQDRDARRRALFEKNPVCNVCEKPIRTLTTAVLFTFLGGSDALVHGSNGGDCYLMAVRESVDRYHETRRAEA